MSKSDKRNPWSLIFYQITLLRLLILISCLSDEMALHTEPFFLSQSSFLLFFILIFVNLPLVLSTSLMFWDSSPRAAFVAIAAEDQLIQMVSSVRQLEHRFNHKYHYDWVFFSHEELSEEFKEATSNATSSIATYNVIPKQHWSIPSWVDSGRFEAGLVHT